MNKQYKVCVVYKGSILCGYHGSLQTPTKDQGSRVQYFETNKVNVTKLKCHFSQILELFQT